MPANRLKSILLTAYGIILALLTVYIIAMLVMIHVSAFTKAGVTDCAESADNCDRNWMSLIADDRKLSSINIPGTHDSCTFNMAFKYSFSCQNSTIHDQLETGFRFLDLRVEIDQLQDKSQAYMVHGIGYCNDDKGNKLKLEDVLDDIYRFLEENSSETVIIMLTNEKDKNTPAEVYEYISNLIEEKNECWYTGNTIPTLGEVRGKVVFCSRMNLDDYGERLGIDFNWPAQTGTGSDTEALCYSINDTEYIWAQNYSDYDIKNKWLAFEKLLDNCKAGDNAFSINYLSTSTGIFLLPHPKINAAKLNRKLLNKELVKGNNYGIVLVDYGNVEIARKIYESN